MPNNEFDACDDSMGHQEWAAKLVDTHHQRVLVHQQTHRFYFRRRVVEYSVKATITASMAIALIWGGPPFWIIGGAALMLSIATIVLNRFNPKQFIDGTIYQAKSSPESFVEEKALETFRRSWLEERSKYLFARHGLDLRDLQHRVAFVLVVGFVVFTILNASLSLPVLLAGMGFAAALIRNAHEIPPPYVEEEKQLSTLFVN